MYQVMTSSSAANPARKSQVIFNTTEVEQQLDLSPSSLKQSARALRAQAAGHNVSQRQHAWAVGIADEVFANTDGDLLERCKAFYNSKLAEGKKALFPSKYTALAIYPAKVTESEIQADIDDGELGRAGGSKPKTGRKASRGKAPKAKAQPRKGLSTRALEGDHLPKPRALAGDDAERIVGAIGLLGEQISEQNEVLGSVARGIEKLLQSNG